MEKVVSVVRNAILAGTWQPGSALPSARQLGEDLHVNKNTVSKAYGLLTREGLLDVSRGRRARATPSARRARPPSDVFRGELRGALEPVLRSARMLGLRSDEVNEAVRDELTSFYETATAQVTLVECNRTDAQQYAAELSALLGTAVGWTVIGDLRGARGTNLFVVPYFHLDDVQGQVEGARVVGLHVAPDPSVLLDVLMSAREPGARVGLVCGNPSSAKRFSRLFEFYTTKTIEITHFRDEKATARMLAHCSRVYATSESHAAVQKLAHRRQVMLLRERIDAESLGPLRALLADLAKTPGVPRAAAAGVRR